MSVLCLNFLKFYNDFIDNLSTLFPDESTNQTLNMLKNLPDEVKLSNGRLFASSITGDNFDLFIKSKIKVFSHKDQTTRAISESLFGPQFCLKNLLNNQPDNIKLFIWTQLRILWVAGEMTQPEDQQNHVYLDTLRQINKDVFNTSGGDSKQSGDNSCPSVKTQSRQTLQEMLGVEVNDQTTEMIDDIVGSFEKILTNSDSGANPLAGIMEVSQKISTKYADKINNGDIELGKLMQTISKKVPGMEQMMTGMSGMFGGSSERPKEKIIMDENFSTADIKLGGNKDESKTRFDIGNILKMADQFGVLPGGKTTPDPSSMQNLGLGKMMELMGKLDSTKSQEEVETLKQEMDSFLQTELGVDVNKLNAQLETHLKK